LTLALTAVLITCAGGVAVATHPYPNNGVFIEHGYMAVSKTDAEIQAVTQWCQARSVVVQFLNITAFNADGTMDPATTRNWPTISR
jgi:hypothetical protein